MALTTRAVSPSSFFSAIHELAPKTMSSLSDSQENGLKQGTSDAIHLVVLCMAAFNGICVARGEVPVPLIHVRDFPIQRRQQPWIAQLVRPPIYHEFVSCITLLSCLLLTLDFGVC